MLFETLTLNASVFQVLITIIAVISIVGTVVMRRRSRFNRSRRLLATSLSTWSIGYIYVAVRLALGHELTLLEPYLNMSYCLVCMFFTLAFLTYPVEVVLPGWLSETRWIQCNIPALGAVMMYVLSNLSEQHQPYHSFSGLFTDFFDMHVWPRFLLIAMTYGYLFFVVFLVVKQSKRYRKWCQQNYAEGAENHTITWLYVYLLLLFIVTTLFFRLIIDGSPVALLAHCILVIVMMIYVIIFGNKQDSAFPEGYFKNDMSADMHEEDEVVDSFIATLPHYVRTIRNWLDSVKPYLDPNFKLIDTAAVVPLNRSYLSRIYNDGFGKSFTILVRDRRIAEARRLMADFPDLSISEVALKSGFASRTTFHRAFVTLNDGLTPGEYKESLGQIG